MKLFELKIGVSPYTTKESKLLGAYVPRQIADYMAMFCLHNEIIKSNIIRQLIEDWHTRTMAGYPEKQLIENLTYTIQHAWNMEKINCKLTPDQTAARIKEIKNELAVTLTHRGLCPLHITEIIEGLKP